MGSDASAHDQMMINMMTMMMTTTRIMIKMMMRLIMTMMIMITPGWLVICSRVGAASYVHQSLDWNVLDFGVKRYQREFYIYDNARGEIM